MTNLLIFGEILTVMLLSFNAHAGDIQIHAAWSRATAPGQANGMADITLTSKQAATLVGVSSTAAKSTEMHSMSHSDGMMKMREVKAIELPANEAFNFNENGYHLMLIGLSNPLIAGDSVPLRLRIRIAGKDEVEIEAMSEVKSLSESKVNVQNNEHPHHH